MNDIYPDIKQHDGYILIDTNNHNNLSKLYSYCFDIYTYDQRRQFTFMSLLIQILLIICVFELCNVSNYSKIMMSDSVISLILFVCKYHNINVEAYLYQEIYFNRLLYIYIICIFYWFINQIYIIPILMLPYTIHYITNLYKFKQLSKYIYNKLENIIYFILSNEITKILNKISINYLNYDPQFKCTEIKPYIKRFTVHIFINFIESFILASILKYIESTGTTVVSAIIRQYFFKQYYSKKLEKKEYIIKLMKNRKWNKLLDAYTLNKLICIYIGSNDGNDDIMVYMHKIRDYIISNCNIVLGCWTISTLFNNYIGFMSYIIFVDKKYIVQQLLSIIVCIIINSNEILLNLILCRLLFITLSLDIITEYYKKLL